MRAGGGDNSMMGTLVVRAGGQRAPLVLLPRLFCVGVVSGAGVPLLAFTDAVVVGCGTGTSLPLEDSKRDLPKKGPFRI